MKKLLAYILTITTLLCLLQMGVSAAGSAAGDANGDGKTDMKDVLVIRKYLAHVSASLTADNADVNKDGKIDMKDVLMIRKYLAHVFIIEDGIIVDPNAPFSEVKSYALNKSGEKCYLSYEATYNKKDQILDEKSYAYDTIDFELGMVPGNMELMDWLEESYRYNSKWQLVHEDLDGGYCRVDYTYNEDGTVATEKNVVGFDDDYDETLYTYQYEESSQGKITTAIDQDGTIVYQYKYDTKGRILEELIDGYLFYVYTYDPDGKHYQIKSYNMFEEDLAHTIDVEMDENGNDISYVYRWNDGTIESVRKKEYDSNGNCTKTTDYDDDGKMSFCLEQKYDEKNRIIEEKEYDSTGEMYSWEVYEYTLIG